MPILRLYIARQAYTDRSPTPLTRYAELGTMCILCSSVYVSDRSAVCVNFGLLWLFCCLSSRFSLWRELCGAIIVRCSKVDLAVLFGLLAFLLNFVPNVGAVLSATLAAASTRRSIASMHHRRSLRIALHPARCKGDSPFASVRRAAPSTVCVALFVCIGCCGHSVASCGTMYVASDHASAALRPQLPLSIDR